MTIAKTKHLIGVTSLVLQATLFAGLATAQPPVTLAGRWDATVIVNGVEVPFHSRSWRYCGIRRATTPSVSPGASGIGVDADGVAVGALTRVRWRSG